MTERSFLTLKQVARELNVAYDTCRRWVRSGELDARRLPGGRLLRVPKAEVDRILGRDDDSDEDD